MVVRVVVGMHMLVGAHVLAGLMLSRNVVVRPHAQGGGLWWGCVVAKPNLTDSNESISLCTVFLPDNSVSAAGRSTRICQVGLRTHA